MRALIVAAEFATGIAYTGLGILTVYEMLRERQALGRSQFGLAFALMAFTCGPHHLLRGVDAATTPHLLARRSLVALLVGLPPGLTFVALRIEALRGGRADRTIHAGASLVPGLVAMLGVVTGGVFAAALVQGVAVDPWFALANGVLAASYLAVGWYILTTQLRRFGAHQTWSLSGLALGFIFPTCALVHASHVLASPLVAGHAHASVTFATRATSLLDLAGLPASIWFLIVVRRLYQEGLADWNRRPLVGRGLVPRRLAPWDLS